MLGSRFTFLLLKITPAIFLLKLFLALIFGEKNSNVLIVTATVTLVQSASSLQQWQRQQETTYSAYIQQMQKLKISPFQQEPGLLCRLGSPAGFYTDCSPWGLGIFMEAQLR